MPELDASGFEPAVRAQIESAAAAARSSSADPAATAKLGMVLHVYGKVNAAAAAYGRAHALEPERFDWSYYYGRALAAAGRDDEAIAVLKEIVEVRPEYTALRITLGDLLLSAHEIDAAEKQYRAAVEQDAELASAYYGLGQVLKAQGRVEAASEQYARAVSLAPHFGPAHYALGMVCRDLKQSEKAQRHLELSQRFRQVRPPIPDPLMDTVLAHGESARLRTIQAGKLLASGQEEEAIEELLEALALNPNYIEAHVDLISLYANRNQFAKAEEHFRNAVSISANAQTARLKYARALVRQKRAADALAVLEELVDINPYSASGHVLLGSVLDDLGRTADAMQHYREALRHKPDLHQANLLVGLHFIRARDLPAAKPYLDKAFTVDAFNLPIVQYRIGVALGESGYAQHGVKFLMQARESARQANRQPLAAKAEKQIARFGGVLGGS